MVKDNINVMGTIPTKQLALRIPLWYCHRFYKRSFTHSAELECRVEIMTTKLSRPDVYVLKCYSRRVGASPHLSTESYAWNGEYCVA